MIEVVALMMGQIEQRYSDSEYDDPRPMEKGMMLSSGRSEGALSSGQQHGRAVVPARPRPFCRRPVAQPAAAGVRSRYSPAFGQALVETDVAVRSLLATPAGKERP